MGPSVDWNATKAYSPGDFIYVPARHSHYGGAREETVIQLHGEGPFQLFLGSPK
jgi:quercetin dioxygenase-like cupin family protein